MSPHSISPTTKKSNLSTLEENNLDLQVRSIGQSLTDRLHMISNDKRNKFNSTTTSGIQNIIQTLKSKEAKCTCKSQKLSS